MDDVSIRVVGELLSERYLPIEPQTMHRPA
jgi:hypothetical protein